MNIQLDNISKRYQQEWIIKDFSYAFQSGKVYGIRGINGTGKSTLLKILSASLSPSKGEVRFLNQGKPIEAQHVYKHVAFAAAEDELVEELTIIELLDHVSRFQTLSLSSSQFVTEFSFKKHKDKTISAYSSGMKQRLKLGLTICAQKSIKLFDEPTSYLDIQNKQFFYEKLVESKKPDDLICIASNDEEDFAICDLVLSL